MTTRKFLNGMRSALAALALAGAVRGYAADSKPVAISEKPAIEAAWANLTAKSAYTTNGGVMFNNNPVFQHDLGAVVKGTSFDVWNNYDTKNHQYNEFDFTASRPFSAGNINGSVSAGVWTYPHTGYSNAPYIKIAISPKNLPLGLEASLSSSKLWCKESHGLDTDLEVSRNINLPGKLGAKLGIIVDYNDRFYSKESGLACLNPYATVTLPITKSLSATAGIKSQHAQKSFKGATSQNIYSLGFDLDLKALGERK